MHQETSKSQYSPERKEIERMELKKKKKEVR